MLPLYFIGMDEKGYYVAHITEHHKVYRGSQEACIKKAHKLNCQSYSFDPGKPHGLSRKEGRK